MYYRFAYFLVNLGLFTACTSAYSPDLRNALVRSGNNRGELEAVLQYFKQDTNPLKYKAAEFLITNMPEHYSYYNDSLNLYIQQIKEKYPDLPFNQWPYIYMLPISRIDFMHYSLVKQEDVKILNSEYLIRHINDKFDLWYTAPWGKDMSFDTFCRYLLPYRIDKEPLSAYNEDSISKYTNKIRNQFCFIANTSFTVSKDRNYILEELYGNERYRVDLELPYPIGKYTTDCIAIAYFSLIKMKLAGIPAAIDFTPHWADVNGRHYWNRIFSPHRKLFFQNNLNEYSAPKIYRKTYAHNPQPQGNGIDYIPEELNTPFLEDVTDEYIDTFDFTLPIRTKKGHKPKTAYLCVFNGGEWCPVAWASIKHNKAFFKKIGVDILYLPVYYHGLYRYNAGPPFYLSSNKEITFYQPNKKNLITLTLKRKFPMSSKKLRWGQELVGARIEASNNADFIQPDTIFTINVPCYNPYCEIPINTSNKYRYWRITAPSKSKYIDLAELIFRDSLRKKITGTPIMPLSNKEPMLKIITEKLNRNKIVRVDTASRMWRIFDNNLLSYTSFLDWIGIDMGKDVAVSSIVYIPRNDENFIYPGDTYKLFYMDQNGWNIVGTQKAVEYQIIFDSIPSNAVYWLQNLSKGNEERPFVYANNKILFF